MTNVKKSPQTHLNAETSILHHRVNNFLSEDMLKNFNNPVSDTEALVATAKFKASNEKPDIFMKQRVK